MTKFLRRKERAIAALLLIIFISSAFLPSVAFALTSGPSQPESQGFQPVGATDMVDLFSGDFSYNIPLFELPGPNGGYPFNLSYQSGIGMDQEASWVGLGWSLNPGAINRQMRGFPDEFRGDIVKTKMSIEPNVTIGLGAGAGLEIFGNDNISLGVGFSISQNNYKGFGYSIDASLGFQGAASSGMTGGVGLNVSLNPDEGLNVSPSMSFVGINLGVGFNSREGLNSVSWSQTVGQTKKFAYSGKNKNVKGSWNGSASTGGSISLASSGYTPQISMPMNNANVSAEFKAGGAWWAVFGSPYIRGFYNAQSLKNNKTDVSSNAYGYLNYQYATNPSDLMDINREKDGIVTKEAPNLAIPSLTYDIYSVTGQGIGTMYRPLRNDIGIVRDAEVSSSSTGGSVGVDVGPAASHIGVNLALNHSRSISGEWSDGNNTKSLAKFKEHKRNDAFQPWYFKVQGEPSSEKFKSISDIGGNKAVRVKLNGEKNSVTASSSLEKGDLTNTPSIPNLDDKTLRERKETASHVQPITREQLLNGSGPVLDHFKFQYVTSGGVSIPFDWNNVPNHHVAAYTAVNSEGLRYNYGIPAMNLKHEEVTFSANKAKAQSNKVVVEPGTAIGEPKYEGTGYDQTDKFLKKVEIPAYAHSYLLTSILGPDYIDVTGDGVTHDDLGYWVKFTYKKITTNESAVTNDGGFRWRDPFHQAHYQEGWKNDSGKDDKGTYTYGVKEIWYLQQAETKSHVAIFNLVTDRLDGKGAGERIQNDNALGLGASLKRLDDVTLYSRNPFTGATNTSTPIKKVVFTYNNSLCYGLPNSTGTTEATTGKLTLESLRFEYGSSTKGAFTPYVFTYGFNTQYNQLAYDRWGNYKPVSSEAGKPSNIDFPYVDQNPANKTTLDQGAAAWSLTKIKLPSGGEIKIDYEIDDYAYVQHMPAMQMVELVSPTGDGSATEYNLTDASMKVRFRLEKPINVSDVGSTPKSEFVLKYLDKDRKQIFFKLFMNLKKDTENVQEYITGYADINMNTATMDLEKAISTDDFYSYGTFQVKAENIKEAGVESSYHPFSLRTWQHLRTNQPDLAKKGTVKKMQIVTNDNDLKSRIEQIKSLGAVGPELRKLFGGFNKYCAVEAWGRKVNLGKSWVRLNSPDKVKYGGGLRVKQITMKDNWASSNDGVYGQIYEYTTLEDGTLISSGVAAYEPLAGGEENPLRYAKKFTKSIPLRSDNNLFFEYPVNESYYPGPQVGYSKVTVTSLASARLASNNALSDEVKAVIPSGTDISYGTSGQTIHEFYTAKDFPVISDETEKVNKPYKLSVPIPLLGHISISKLTASQGYSIITNDMHGKPKMVSNYRQDHLGKMEPQASSWVKYTYHQNEIVYQGKKASQLKTVFKQNNDGTLSAATNAEIGDPALTDKYTLGQHHEFFMDMREFKDNTWGGGAAFNTDILYIPIIFAVIPIPAFMVWPSVSKTEVQLRTVTTNKVIHQSGIIDKVEAYTEGSLITTQNIKWDKLTGQVVLNSVNNNYDNPIFNYSIPAYTQYQGMGSASKNLGATLSMFAIQPVPNKSKYYFFFAATPKEMLFAGDELLIYPAGQTVLNSPIAKVIYTGDENGIKTIYCDKTTLTAGAYEAMIVRSGYRNQLTVMAGNITALTDPSQPGAAKSYTKTIQVPSN